MKFKTANRIAKNDRSFKDLRNRIVHHKGYARKKTWPITIKDDTETIDEISVDKTYLMAAVDDMHEFALAVESNYY